LKRICIVVLDSVGVGYLPDAHEYNDFGANTLLHIDENTKMNLPNMEKLGLGNIIDFKNIKKEENPTACYGKMAELSKGKDTITGHWEIAGIVLEKPFPVYENGFPEDIIKKFEKLTGKKVIGNKPASGTEILKELGEKHLSTGALIVYTSADSVFQIAAHESLIPVDELYDICIKARKLLTGEHSVGRVIARPFNGNNKDDFKRTQNRKDFPLRPYENMLEKLKENGLDVMAVGKIEDIFAGYGITLSSGHNDNNKHGVDNTIKFLKEKNNGLIFTNLVDFDMVYGHRNDFKGYAKALEEFDSMLPKLMNSMKEDDILIITADHGCDPLFPGTDHTREYVPLIVYGKNIKKGVNLGIRKGFNDISATVLEYFNIEKITGESFLGEINV